ncbi:MAG: hypothetical protein KAS32_22065 [Candidatus Peribacteraceae bacterium]|nr:hypothetical protein [Candidatus Peribacteraceae bacterium]
MTLREILKKSSPGDYIFNLDSGNKIEIGENGEMELWPNHLCGRKFAILSQKEMFLDDNWMFDHIEVMHHCDKCEVETKGHTEIYKNSDEQWLDFRCGECNSITRMKNKA